MVKLSLNVNKIATLRNARGGHLPHPVSVVQELLKWGAQGITVHPRPDGRHILFDDVRQIGEVIRDFNDAHGKDIEFNVEGYPSSDFLTLMDERRPDQCTLVPDPPSALTSDQGWDLAVHFDFLKRVLARLKKNHIRSSLFIDPLKFSEKNLKSLSDLKPDRVEFYTGAFAKSCDLSEGVFKKNAEKNSLKAESAGASSRADFSKISSLSERASKEDWLKDPVEILRVYRKLALDIHALGIGLNAGHDLNQKNLKPLIEAVPFIQEVSIGHAFVCDSLYDGLQQTLKNYQNILSSAGLA